MRDLANLLLLALTTPGAANKRFVVGQPLIFNDLADALRKDSQLGVADKIGENNNEAETLTLPRLETSELEEVFGFKWTPMETTVRDVAASLLALEKKA